jgi:hypothetical protein
MTPARVFGAVMVALLSAGPAVAAPAKPPVPERDLGEIAGFEEAMVVPADGLRFRLVAVPPGASRRTMFEVEAAGQPLRGRPAVRLRIRGPARSETRSPDSCFESLVHPPPFVECTANAGTGWDDGRPRKLLLAIDNLAGKPVSVNVRIVIMDPLE